MRIFVLNSISKIQFIDVYFIDVKFISNFGFKNSFINLFIRRDRLFDVLLLFDVSFLLDVLFLFDAIVYSTRSFIRRDRLFDTYST